MTNDELKKFANDAKDVDGGMTVTVSLEDGNEIECAVLTIFTVDGGDYIALLPIDENGVETGSQVYLYGYVEDETGIPELINIESESEYRKIADRFAAMMDEEDAKRKS